MEDFFYVDSALDLDNFWFQEYYDQMLTLTAISSFNREEWIGNIRWKQAMIWRNDPKIYQHCLSYEAASVWWKKFLDNQMDFRSFCEKTHIAFMTWLIEEKSLEWISPWEIRTNTVFIWGSEPWIENAAFINPCAKEVPQWLEDIWEYITWALRKWVDIYEIAWNIHYMILVLHPFQDWNWRLARILSITFLEAFWLKDARWFTFFSELLKSNQWDKNIYEQSLNTPEEKALTNKIKNWWLKKDYDESSLAFYEGNKNLTFQDYMDELSSASPRKYFMRIFSLLEEKNALLQTVIKIFLRAKNLKGDHKLIWKFLSRLFDAITNTFDWKGATILVDKTLINSNISSIDWKLKNSSVTNLIRLIEKSSDELKRIWIEITISEEFFTQALELGILTPELQIRNIKKKMKAVI